MLRLAVRWYLDSLGFKRMNIQHNAVGFSYYNQGIKKSSRLYILGSGASIAQYSDFDFDEIRQHDSIGLNFWLVHPFVPDWYVFEGFGGDHYNESIFLKLSEEKGSSYNNTSKIFSGNAESFPLLDKLPEIFKKNLRTLPRGKSIDSGNNKIFRQRLKFLRASGFYKIFKCINFLPRFTSTVPYLIFWAVLCGYKEIVLCGVDMESNEYFFQSSHYKHKSISQTLPYIPELAVHPTYDIQKKKITTDEAIRLMDEAFLKPLSIKLTLFKKFSPTHPLDSLGYLKA